MIRNLDTQEERKVLDTDRYILGEALGDGTWGVVYSAEDNLTGEKVAIKVLEPTDLAKKQMFDRNLDLFKAMKNEATRLSAYANVVPRTFDVDKNGRPFIVMPKYNKFMSDILGDNGHRSAFNNGVGLEQLTKYAKDIASGLSEMHSKHKIGRVHGDLKPDNLALDEEGNVLLNDLGSSTCTSLGRSVSPRDNIGFLYTRAPECFRNESHPTKNSDVWAFGSLMYRLFTGKYVFEDELNNSKDPILYFENLDKDITDKMIKRKLKKNIPRKFRKFLGKCLDISPYSRYISGKELKKDLEKVIENLDTKKAIKNHIKKWTLPIGLPLISLGLLGYSTAIYEPKHLEIPKVQVHGQLSLVGDYHTGPIKFDLEKISDLPEVSSYNQVDEKTIKLSTHNFNVACLLKSYMQAQKHLGLLRSDLFNDYQTETWSAYTSLDEKSNPALPRTHYIPAKSIEVALAKSKMPNGEVDLEDALAIARLGETKVNEAKRAAKSFNFKDYIEAKDSKMRYIIPEKEQRFLKHWLAYTHELFK